MQSGRPLMSSNCIDDGLDRIDIPAFLRKGNPDPPPKK